MRYCVLSLKRSLLACSFILGLSATSAFAVDVPASSSAGTPLGTPSGALKGEYWKRPVASILTDGAGNRANGIDNQINTFGAPNGSFRATSFVYLGNDLSPVVTWLGTDGASFTGTADNLDDGAFRFTGFLNVAAPGTVNIGANTDDGTRIKIGGVDVVNDDGSHGDQTVNADATFAAAGLYPIEITYFNGDWTSDGGHNGSTNPADHGGANFRLLVNGANITAPQVAAMFHESAPTLLPNVAQIGGNKVGSVTNHPDGSITIVGGGNDIWDGRDEFTYAYTDVTGDFDVQARVVSLTANGQYSKAGLMVRETLSEFSRMAFPRVTSDQAGGQNDVRFSYRTGIEDPDNVNPYLGYANGGAHEDGGGTPSGIPNAWLRLSRVGNVIYASNSADGVTWNLLSSQDTATWGGGALSNRVFIGLAVARNGNGPTATAVFDDIQFNTNGAAFTVVGASSRGNPTGIRVSFNNPVGTGALTPGNYIINTISGPNVTVVTGLRFTTANDAPERDPMTFTLEGTLGDANTGPWTLIASGNTGLDTVRFATAPDVLFANTTAYKAYRLLFPTVRNAAAANSMQISEVAFLDAGGNDVTAPGDAVIPTSSNSPGAEQSPLAIDNNPATKYLNFDKLNTGFTVTPSGGGTPSAPTVLAAAHGPVAGTIQLTTTPLVEGATYEIAVNNVQSAGGLEPENVLATFTHGAGYEVRRIHVTHNKTDDSGYYRNSDAVRRGIGDVTALGGGVFPPVQSNTVFEDPIPDTGSNERFSSRVAGILRPTANGNYTFYMSSDDQGFLYLSTDQNPANKVQIANEPAWNGVREYIAGGNQGSRGSPPANISAPKTLAAGGKYYLELIFTEGGGGNNGSATWLPPGGAAITNGASPIPESAFAPSRLVDGNSFQVLGPVQIVSQPANQSVTALTPVTFRVGVDGTPGYTFQWRRNGVAIPGATEGSYTIPVTPLTDDQATFSVVVANEFSTVTSSNATLTVLVPQSPHLTGVAADDSFSRVTVTFDNRVLTASAQNIANYSIPGLTILSATRDSTGRRVVLTTSPITEGAPYSLTVSNIQDETGTTILDPNPSTRNFTGWVFSQGFAFMEVYPTGGGNAVSVLTSHPSYPNSPSERYFITAIDSRQAYPNDAHEGYGGRISGLFIPPTNGNYIISLRSDDASELWASPDSSTAGLARIAQETGCCNAFTRVPPLASSPIPLVAGNRYAYQVLWKEGTGGDYAQVSIDGISVVPSSMLGLYANPDAVSININQQPQSVTRDVNGFASFTVGATLTTLDGIPRTLLYQWRSNGVDIAGANGPTYNAPILTAANNGDVYSVVVRAPGAQVVSSNAVVTVQTDLTKPVLLSARASLSFNSIRLTFSELMDGGLMDPGNFTLEDAGMNQIFVSSTEHTTNAQNQSEILLRLASPLTMGGVYRLEVDYQADLAGNTTLGSGNPTGDPNGVVTNVYAYVENPGYVLKELYMGLSTSSVAISDLRSSPKYPDAPDIVRYGDLLELNTFDEFEGYGARLRGWLIPPVSGAYTFYIASDDNGELWLSTDADPANKVNIANEPVWSGRRTWTGEAGGGGRVGVASPSGGPQANISGPITLVAGQHYYFEALVKEGGGGDNLAVAWKLPGGADPAIGSLPIEGQYISSLADLSGASLTVTQQPTSQSFSGTTTAFAPDFNANDGGFFVEIPAGQGYAGPWHWEVSTGSWREDGQGPETGHPNTSILNTPALTVKTSGIVALSFDHRYSRESGNWDGANLRISVNGGDFTTVPNAAFTQNGYNGTVLPGSTSVLHGQEAFVNESAGFGAGTFITSIAGGTFNAGDVLRLQFVAASDGNTAGNVPNWEINSMGSPNLDAYVGNSGKTVTFSVAATGANFLGSNPAMTYQWFRDNGSGFVAIPGATSQSYTIAPAPSDNGVRFRATVSIVGATATSAAATLTVGTPPTLRIQKVGGQVTISWSGSLCLQEADQITGPWGASTRVNGTPFTPPGTGNKFYRLATCPP